MARDLHIGTASLRNAFDQLHSHLPGWIDGCLHTHGRLPDSEYEGWEYCWQALQVEEGLIEELAEMQLRFVDGKLLCRQWGGTRKEHIQELTNLLMALFTFIVWTLTRWCTAGPSSRHLVVALLLGLHALVGTIWGDQKSSKYYINGFKRLGEKQKRVLIVTGLASLPMEHILSIMQKDGRMLMVIDKLRATMSVQLQYLQSLPFHIWEKLADIGIDIGPLDLRHRTVMAAQISVAFFEQDTLARYSGYPWSLARLGTDPEANIRKLMADPQPVEDPTTRNIKVLALGAFPMWQLVLAVLLFREVEGHVLEQERAHGSAAVIHKYHKDLGINMLCARAFIHMTWVLFAGPQVDRVLLRLQKKLDRLHRRRPQNRGGKEYFLKVLFSRVRRRLNLAPHQKMPLAVVHNVVADHAVFYNALSLGERIDYDDRAQEEIRAKQESIELQIEQVEQHIHDHHQKKRQEIDGNGLTLTLGNCRCTAEELEKFQVLWSTHTSSSLDIANLRQAALQSPVALEALTMIAKFGLNQTFAQAVLCLRDLWDATLAEELSASAIDLVASKRFAGKWSQQIAVVTDFAAIESLLLLDKTEWATNAPSIRQVASESRIAKCLLTPLVNSLAKDVVKSSVLASIEDLQFGTGDMKWLHSQVDQANDNAIALVGKVKAGHNRERQVGWLDGTSFDINFRNSEEEAQGFFGSLLKQTLLALEQIAFLVFEQPLEPRKFPVTDYWLHEGVAEFYSKGRRDFAELLSLYKCHGAEDISKIPESKKNALFVRDPSLKTEWRYMCWLSSQEGDNWMKHVITKQLPGENNLGATVSSVFGKLTSIQEKEVCKWFSKAANTMLEDAVSVFRDMSKGLAPSKTVSYGVGIMAEIKQSLLWSISEYDEISGQNKFGVDAIKLMLDGQMPPEKVTQACMYIDFVDGETKDMLLQVKEASAADIAETEQIESKKLQALIQQHTQSAASSSTAAKSDSAKKRKAPVKGKAKAKTKAKTGSSGHDTSGQMDLAMSAADLFS